MEELRFKSSEMKGGILDIYDLPPETDIYLMFEDYFNTLPYWKYNFKLFKDQASKIRSQFIRYVNYFYSPGIKCIKAKFPEQMARRMACAKLAGFEFDAEGRLDKKVEDMILGRNHATNQMIISFCQITGSRAYASIAHLDNLYYKALLAENGTQLDSAELGKMIDNLRKINDIEKEFLGDGKKDKGIPEFNISLIQRITAERLNYTPEDIAEKLDQGLNPLEFNPYKTPQP